ncbi:MAG: hypothetical protein ACXVBE_11215, partial [Bdellovibrionota bacterium]
KKFVIISMACLSIATSALAAPSPTGQVNAEIRNILSAFQNSRTQASLSFKELATNGKQALSLAMTALYKKVGAKNSFTLSIDNLSYKYGDRPLTKGNGAVKVDLVKMMGQEEINQLVPNIETMVNGLANSFATKYGQAGQLAAKVTDLKKDAQGNYVGLNANITFQLNYANLPANINKDEVMFDSGRVSLSLNATQGFTFNFEFVSNKEYKGFSANEHGLKEYIDALLAKDAKTLDEIKTIFRQLDEGAEGIVEGKLL